MRGEKKLLVLFFFTVLFFTGCVKKSDKTVIQFASWGSQSEVEIIKPILAEFEREYPNIKVDFIHIPQNYFQKIHLLFASNLAPDVLFINNLYLPIYAKAKVLDEIEDKEYLSNFYEKSVKSLSFDGKVYAIPRDISTMVVYYNKDLFDKYDVKVPNKYWSFDDFLAIARKLTKDTDGDGKTDVWGISFEEDLLYYLPFLTSEGGGVLSDDSKTSILNAPESQKGLKFYADLRKRYHVAPTEAESASETMAQMFLQGKLAMYISGRWMVPKFREDANFDWNVVNFPAGDKGSVVPLDASGWAIAKSSKHKSESIRLIKYLSSKESIEKFSKSGLIVPARIDAAKGYFIHDKEPPSNNKVFLNVIKTAKPTPVSINYNEIIDDLKEKTNYLFN